MLAVVIGWFAWWAASRIDDRSIARETQAIRRGLREISDRLPVEQDSSAIWDDAVVNLRAGNEAWIAENLAEWMSEYFGHDRVYILDPGNQPIRAVENGELLPAGSFEEVRTELQPLIVSLREQMADAAAGETDSTDSVTGLGSGDLVVLRDGRRAIASIRPVVPSSHVVLQAPGTEYLHISLLFVDQTVTDEIGQRYDVKELTFEQTEQSDQDRIAIPVMDSGGRIVGFMAWVPNEPAYELIKETAPATGGAASLILLGVGMLLRRLQRTSIQLEDSKAEASYLAFHDRLTHIPNRALFEDRLEQALANMRRTGASIALHCIDLDRFKHVNDTLGHPVGDNLIRQAAQRLSSLLDEVDTVARLGGDEFAIIQFTAMDTPAAIKLSQRVVEALQVPFELSGHEVRIGASVGVVVSADMDMTAEDMMRQADIALYEAKTSGRGRYQLFAGELDAIVRERRALELDLRAALLAEGDLQLEYQPIYHAVTGSLEGAEALVRWQHPTRGRLSPAMFVALAEERGLIDQLGAWVLREACGFAVASGAPWVAVNVSPIQFRDEHFADRVFDILTATGLMPERLELEVTEGLLLQNSPLVQSTLKRLRTRGVRVALDDFGTGYSSISYLRTHGIDKLKIDQSFTAHLGLDGENDSIVRSIIDLGRALHMVVTAEGVETPLQRRLLTSMGCDQLQGYLLSRPLPSDKFCEQVYRTGASPEPLASVQ